MSLLTGTPPDSGTVIQRRSIHYVIFRQSDVGSKTPMEPGSSLNWVQTLFSNPGGTPPFFARTTGQALVAAAGTTPDYIDIGNPVPDATYPVPLMSRLDETG